MMRIIKLIKIACLLLVLLLVNPSVWAQVKGFKYKADISKIDSSGVYRIELNPGLIAKSREDLNDIRITDNTGKFIAYALSNKLSINYPDSFIVFPEVTVDTNTDTASVYVAENRNELNISQLWLKLKKAEVSRTVNLSGSDDLKKWFAIKEGIPLEEAGDGKSTDYNQVLTFPNSNYRYFKVQIINGKDKTPVKILQLGIYTANLNKPVYTMLPPVKFNTVDTGKVSHISIRLNESYQINKLHFNIATPKYYNRRVVVYSIKGSGIDQLIDTTISSGGLQDILLSAKTSQLRVDIFNGDDNALAITSIGTFQVKQYAISYLESGYTYNIFTGDSSAKEANYDLSFLNNQVYNQLPGINHRVVYKNPIYTIAQPPVIPDHSILLWVSIIVVLVVLSFLTLKMVRELK
jgi:hypothetical protein